MVQRMLDNKNFESKLKNNKSIGIQTGDENERCLTISDTKKREFGKIKISILKK